GGGANDLAREVGEVLGAEPVVTTATDAVGLPGLDTLGLPVEGDVAAVSRALLDGEAVALRAEVTWPLPPLP
ncbi:precorrin-3B C(17)-methyltransferase, partial [Actinospica acidiphila]